MMYQIQNSSNPCMIPQPLGMYL